MPLYLKKSIFTINIFLLLCLFLSLSLCLSLSVPILYATLCLSVFVSVSLCLSFWVSPYVCMSLSVYHCESVSFFICLYVSLCICLLFQQFKHSQQKCYKNWYTCYPDKTLDCFSSARLFRRSIQLVVLCYLCNQTLVQPNICVTWNDLTLMIPKWGKLFL